MPWNWQQQRNDDGRVKDRHESTRIAHFANDLNRVGAVDRWNCRSKRRQLSQKFTREASFLRLCRRFERLACNIGQSGIPIRREPLERQMRIDTYITYKKVNHANYDIIDIKTAQQVASLQSMPTMKHSNEDGTMASLTIRNLDDDLKQRLSVRAAVHGHSMEEEARRILRNALAEPAAPRNLAAAIHARMAPLGGVDLEIEPREPMRDPITFD